MIACVCVFLPAELEKPETPSILDTEDRKKIEEHFRDFF